MLVEEFERAQIALLCVYFLMLGLLAFYGSHRYLMVYLYRRFGALDPEPEGHFADDELPPVTIQLPLYNERYVCERLIDAVCGLDYPQDKLQIQVLDDSTDRTTTLVAAAVERWRALGVNIEHIHRVDRTGYKAGALAHGLKQASGDFVAIFDADFIPQPEFLRKTVHFFTDSNIGMVQARWEHLNRDYSLLTRAQAVLLDGHFVIEHTARNRSGRFFNFNGTAGIWRRIAIDEAGGWEHDTLTEDLDLSYRAQLLGWNFIFLRDLAVPSELPVEMSALKSQQHRWAKGSIQTAKKMLPTILKSDQPAKIKVEAVYHLTANLAYLFLVVLAVLMPVATVIRLTQGWWVTLFIDLPIFMGATFSICVFYWLSQRELGKSNGEIFKLLPTVLALGIGISLNNSKAVIEGLLGHRSPFVRTPKYNVSDGESWTSRVYRNPAGMMCLVEFVFSIWFAISIIYVVLFEPAGLFSLPFLMLFLVGFFYVSTIGFAQGARALHSTRTSVSHTDPMFESKA